MNGSFYHTGNHCRCDLANEAQLCDLYRDHAQSTDGLWTGPVPVTEWRKHFLPPTSNVATRHVDFTSVPRENGQAKFGDCIRESGLCKTIFPRAAHDVHGKDHVGDMYHSLDFTLLSQDLAMDHSSRRTRDELLSSTLAFGALTSDDFDPCAFGDGKPDTDRAASMRGRLAATVQAIAANSHRMAVYAFVLMPELGRLTRFDHTGVVYSELFAWRTSGDLAEFLVSFDDMSAAERGCDMSVAPIAPDSEEVLRAKEILARCDTLPPGVKKSAVIPPNHQGYLSLMHVYDDEAEKFHRVVVHRAISSAECFTGRATRGFYGVDLDDEGVVYAKDTWRIQTSSTEPEAATYKRLGKKDIPRLAGFYLGGDVPLNTPTMSSPSPQTKAAVVYQTTDCTYDIVTTHPEYSRSGDAPGKKMRLYVHHRLLFKHIGRPLRAFKSTRQLCIALLDAIEAHGKACESAQVLHRDISGGNILIDKDGRGMLIDWDMCVWLENKNEVERVGQKIGTWRFISAHLLQGSKPRQHLLCDDLESFVHVLFYHVFRFRPIRPDAPERKKLLAGLHDVFDLALPAGQSDVVGSLDKPKVLLGDGPFSSEFVAEHVKPLALSALMNDVRQAFAPLYKSKPLVDLAGRDLHPEMAQQYRDELATCQQRLQSSNYVASRFRHWLHHYHMPEYPELDWLPDDCAVDQYQTCAPNRGEILDNSRSSRKRMSDTEGETTPAAKARRLSADKNASAGASARSRRGR
ncbi:unnamed protein product [Peniophora sp. CBMAI 1063]|nr:unnamed protein product [Peniophora sp. CBMAI 1063]